MHSPDLSCDAGRRRLLRAAGALGATAGLAGCASPSPDDYRAERPLLDLRRYFDGPVSAHGLVSDRAGRVLRRFQVAIVGRWQGDRGVLEEDFVYSDGERQRRVWHLQDHGDGRYTGRADDVVGEALGQARGNALNWRYTLALPVDGRTWHIDFDDWMFLLDEHVLMNRARMSKLGVTVGEVLLSFHKP